MARPKTNYRAASQEVEQEEVRARRFVTEIDKPVRIRTGPGTNYSHTGKYLGKGEHEIVEVSNGTGSNKGWGKLANGSGWVALDFVSVTSK